MQIVQVWINAEVTEVKYVSLCVFNFNLIYMHKLLYSNNMLN